MKSVAEIAVARERREHQPEAGAMRLEMGSFAVKDLRFSDRTTFSDGLLSINREELRQLLLEVGAFEDVDLEIVRPGDDVRIIHVMDVVEPRHKLGDGSNFPGFVGRQKTVGEGKTHRLAGMAVVSVGDPVAGEPIYWRETIIDMSGPGAVATSFGSTVNLVLDFKPRKELLDGNRPEAVIHNMMIGSALAQGYNRSVRVAELKAAAYLAGATAELTPKDFQVYELAPVEISLPKVVYFFQMSGLVVYGEEAERILPSLIHPNEILDGAIINTLSNLHASSRYSTFHNQNHAIIQELYTHHGTDLNFAGVVVYPATSDELEKKELMAEYAVKLARMLGAQGACSSYLGGGHPCVEFMLICQKCERVGIKTVQVMPESYGTPEDPGFVYFVPEAVRIVSTGRSTQTIQLPAVTRVIGGQEFFDLPDSPAGSLNIPFRYLFGSSTSTGSGQLTARQY